MTPLSVLPNHNPKKRIFHSVFPSPPTESQPHASKRPRQTTTTPSSSSSSLTHDTDKAWHTATAFLSLPDKPLHLHGGITDYASSSSSSSSSDIPRLARRWFKRTPSQAVFSALRDIAARDPNHHPHRGPHDLRRWYYAETRRHFLLCFRAPLVKLLRSQIEKEEREKLRRASVSLVTTSTTGFRAHEEVLQDVYALRRVVRYLRLAQFVYATVFGKYILGSSGSQEEVANASFDTVEDDNVGGEDELRKELHGTFGYALPAHDLQLTFAGAVLALCRITLRDDDDGGGGDGSSGILDAEAAQAQLYDLLRDVRAVGLGGVATQKTLARVMNGMLTEYVETRYADYLEEAKEGEDASKTPRRKTARQRKQVPTTTPTKAGKDRLEQWVATRFAPLVDRAQHILTARSDKVAGDINEDVTTRSSTPWSTIAIARLGALRVAQLYDIITTHPSLAHASPSPTTALSFSRSRSRTYATTPATALRDLRAYATTPLTRYFLTESFSAALNAHLLRPDKSTLRILRTYVRVIRAFAALDGRGVLLERVARGIRRYLREREDCIGIVVRGLLADVSEDETGAVDDWGEEEEEEEEEGPGVLTELAAELGKARREARAKGGGVGSELDWDDMNWMPDPIDAPPEPSGSAGGSGTGTAKSPTDVIGSLLSLFESKDMVVLELQRVLSARLLRGKYTPKDETETKEKDYEKEESVLELLKTRFGEAALQPCEVMLRDVFDSRLTDKAVHVWQAHTRKKEGRKLDQDQPPIDLHARMLSHMYWPPSSKLPSSSSLAAAAVMGTASGSQNAASEFKLPSPVQSAQEAYADTFAHLKRSRKLTWVPSLGTAVVRLGFEDGRTWGPQGVATWQAAVAYAFGGDGKKEGEGEGKKKRTAKGLAEELGMSVSMVRSACAFWCKEGVLKEGRRERDTFWIVERADEADTDDEAEGDLEGDVTSPTQGTAAAAATAQEAEKEEAAAAAQAQADKMNFYHPFIVGMLTNQGAMPLQQIVMMLKIVVPGGFPFGADELKEFLGALVGKGQLEVGRGGAYKIVAGK